MKSVWLPLKPYLETSRLFLERSLRNIRYVLEAFLIVLWMMFFRILPLDVASSVAGIIARMIGPLSRVHKVAAKNLGTAMPELTERDKAKILSDMWDNMGRSMGEYPHLSRPIMRRRITIEGLEHILNVKHSEKGALFVSGHFSNWEVAPLTTSLYGVPLVLIYRAANNPFADKVIRYIRSHYNRAMYRKGQEGARETIKALKDGLPVGMLIDQKMNDGEPIPFFGRDAMTATAAVSLAIKFQVPLLLCHVVRTDGAHFHMIMEPPVYYGQDTQVTAAMADINHIFEEWIREYPAQWPWVHRRWGK